MPINQLNKITWIVNTITNAGKISFEDLNRKWRNNVDMSGGEDLSKRTFHKWRDAIFDTFGLIIECEEATVTTLTIRKTCKTTAWTVGCSTPPLSAIPCRRQSR